MLFQMELYSLIKVRLEIAVYYFPLNRDYQKHGAKLTCFDGVDKEYCIVYVPKETVELYKNTVGWNEFKNIVEE